MEPQCGRGMQMADDRGAWFGGGTRDVAIGLVSLISAAIVLLVLPFTKMTVASGCQVALFCGACGFIGWFLRIRKARRDAVKKGHGFQVCGRDTEVAALGAVGDSFPEERALYYFGLVGLAAALAALLGAGATAWLAGGSQWRAAVVVLLAILGGAVSGLIGNLFFKAPVVDWPDTSGLGPQ